MDPIVSYKAFEINKSYSDVISDSSIWISDFNFLKNELLFFKTILKSNLFKSTIPNLFEKRKLLLKDIDELNENSDAIIERIKKYRGKVTETLSRDVFSFNEGYFEIYHSLLKEIMEFNKNFNSIKNELYEFLIEII